MWCFHLVSRESRWKVRKNFWWSNSYIFLQYKYWLFVPRELGADWESRFLTFETKPFAAASIGRDAYSFLLHTNSNKESTQVKSFCNVWNLIYKIPGVYKVPPPLLGKNIKLWWGEGNIMIVGRNITWKWEAISSSLLILRYHVWKRGRGRKFWGRKSRFKKLKRRRIFICRKLNSPLKWTQVNKFLASFTRIKKI